MGCPDQRHDVVARATGTRAPPDERLGRLRAPPVELLPALAPVAALPLAQPGRHVAVLVRRVLETQRHLPAHVGLPVERPLAGLEGADVQRAPDAAGEARPVEEDARVVDQPGHGRIAVPSSSDPRAQEAAAASLGVELHLLGSQPHERLDDVRPRRRRRRSGRRSCSTPASSPAPARRGRRGTPRRRCSGSWSAGTSRRTPTCAARRDPRS